MEHHSKLRGHKRSVNCLQVGSDGSTLVSASDDKTVRLWDTESGKTTKCVTGCFKSDIEALSFGLAKNIVYVACTDAVSTFDLRKEGLILKEPLTQVAMDGGDEVSNIALNAKGDLLAVAMDSGVINLIPVKPNGTFCENSGATRYRRLARQHTNIVNTVAFKPTNPKELLSGGFDYNACIWETDRAKPKATTYFTALPAPDSDPVDLERAADRVPMQMVNPPFVMALKYVLGGRCVVAALGDGTVSFFILFVSLVGCECGILDLLHPTSHSTQPTFLSGQLTLRALHVHVGASAKRQGSKLHRRRGGAPLYDHRPLRGRLPRGNRRWVNAGCETAEYRFHQFNKPIVMAFVYVPHYGCDGDAVGCLLDSALLAAGTDCMIHVFKLVVPAEEISAGTGGGGGKGAQKKKQSASVAAKLEVQIVPLFSITHDRKVNALACVFGPYASSAGDGKALQEVPVPVQAVPLAITESKEAEAVAVDTAETAAPAPAVASEPAPASAPAPAPAGATEPAAEQAVEAVQALEPSESATVTSSEEAGEPTTTANAPPAAADGSAVTTAAAAPESVAKETVGTPTIVEGPQKQGRCRCFVADTSGDISQYVYAF